MKIDKKKLATIFGLTVFCVIVFLPPIIHGYVYPNIGDDSAMHLEAIELMQSGDMLRVGYLGMLLFGFIINWISNLTNMSIDPLFLWFSYGALALAGITLYSVMSRLMNKQAGWFALGLAIFCAQSVLFQFYFGQIFNLINIAIILPWLLYFTVRYLMDKKVYQLVLTIVFCGLFGVFHTSGIYLPFFVGFAVVSYVIYSLIKKKNMQSGAIIFGISIAVGSIVVAMVIDPFSLMGRVGFGGFMHSIGGGETRMAVPLSSYLLSIVSPTLLVILVFACMFYKDISRNISNEVKVLSALLLSMAIVLIVVTATKISFDPWRTALDLATVLALLATIPIGLLMVQQKNKLIVVVLVLATGFGLFHSIPTWFSYNSAISPADRQAIAYVNTLDYGTYTCSAEIAPWIYNRFTEAKYKKDGSDLFINRSKSMTPRSDENNIWYGNHGVQVEDDFILDKAFYYGDIVVEIYRR